jgi:sister chromatid cohesion protein DCC1
MLKFADDYSSASASFFLLEIPDELIKAVESDTKVTFHFKGKDDEEAVLVTEEKTYGLRRGETSNTQLIFSCPAADLLDRESHNAVADISETLEIIKHEAAFSTGHVLELSLTTPRLKRLPEILSSYAYDGPDSESECDKRKLLRPTIDDLDIMLQASRKEILFELHRLGALCLDGRYCLLGMNYESNLISRVFEACEDNGWWDGSGLSVARMQSVPTLREFPTPVLANFLDKFGMQPPPGPGSPNTGNPAGTLPGHAAAAAGCVELDLPKLALARADELLATFSSSSGGSGGGGVGRISVDEFLFAWAAVLPRRAAGEARMDRLRGRAIVEARGAARLVRPLTPAALSPDPRVRFRQLFELAPAWSREDLLPYVADLAGQASPDQLLLKHTRVTRAGPPGAETRTYSARV